MKIILLTAILFSFTKAFAQLGYTEISGGLGIEHAFDGLLGAGVTFCDFNNDGTDDLSFPTRQGDPLQFYQNIGGSFVEIPAFVFDTSHVKQINWVDIDNDGDRDLYLSIFDGPSRLFRNEGNMVLTDITVASGISINSLAFGSSWGDIDNDGFLDLFVCIRDFTTTNKLYKNNGDNTFTDVSVISGIADLTDFSFCSILFDYDNDNDLDIYVANDKYTTQNKLFQNNGFGVFTDVSVGSGTDLWIDAMTTAIGDPNNDGYFDIYVSNTLLGNQFLNNNGNNTFTNTAPANGTDYLSIGFGALFLDADNDLDLDLYVSGVNHTFNVHSSAFYENDGLNDYTVPTGIGFESDTVNSYGNALGDYNNDGFIDFVTSNEIDSSFFFANNSNSNNWLKIDLEGQISNRDGIGSKITMSVGGTNYYNFTNCGEGYLSQNSFHEFFGLGSNTMADSLTVLWPSGHQDVLYNIPSNQTLDIVEGQTLVIDNTLNANSYVSCNMAVVTISGNGVGDYVWSTGDTTSSIAVTAGQYFATITNQFGFSVNSDTIEIIASSISAQAIGQDISCYNSNDGTASIISSSSTLTSILWNNGADSIQITGLSEAWYSFDIVNTDGCSLTDSILISNPAPLTFTSNSNHEVSGFDGDATVTVSGGTAPYNYFWNDPMAQSDSTATGLAGGNYIVWVTDQNNCIDSVHVFVQSALGLPNLNQAVSVSLYPNPTSHFVSVQSDAIISNIKIFDLRGSIIMQSDSHEMIDIGPLKNGTYLIQIELNSGQLLYRKILKSN